LEGTVGQKNEQTDEDAASLEQNKKSLGWNVTHTKMSEQIGLNCATNNEKTESNKKMCSKLSVVVCYL
jgi:hypothetical protein